MAGSIPAAVRGRWRTGARFLSRMVRRTIVESLYLLTAPVLAAVGLVVVLSGICVGAIGLLVPGGSRVTVGGLAAVRWTADVERWRIARVRPRPDPSADPRWWPVLAHAVVVLPVALVTAPVTALWWFVGVATATSSVRSPYPATPLRPMTLVAGDAQSHIDLSLGLTTPAARFAFGTAVGLFLLCTLPLLTWACVTVQARLGQALLTGREPNTPATAEATALRRLERDIHDGPQQRLVRLAMELGRAQHHFDSRPEAVREALADAIAQTQEALGELRVLSRGIAPPILVDRGLRAALTALAASSIVPVDIDVDPVDRELDTAAETAAYFVVAEAMTNVAKHSHARRCALGLRHEAGTLRVWVTDDGLGGAALAKGHGLRGLADRLHTVGGTLRVTSPDGGPTTILAELPCR